MSDNTAKDGTQRGRTPERVLIEGRLVPVRAAELYALLEVNPALRHASSEELAERLECVERTVRRGLQVLGQAGLVTRRRTLEVN
jgi:predicted ArsR family transcriptional regulator